MRKVVVGLLSAAMVTSVGILLPAVASAAPPVGPTAAPADPSAPLDDLVSPLEAKRRDLRQQAVNGILKGTIKAQNRNGSLVAKVGRTAAGKDQYVELARERTDRIFVILAEFGNDRHPDFPDVDSDPTIPGPTTFDGPLHNSIPEPDRSKDNSTIWQADYDQAHYQQMYFGTGAGVESLKTYYEAQSSGRYSVDGEVTDWVKVKYNEARYGRNCTANGVCGNAQALVADAANEWVADQKAAGRTEEAIQADLASFDQYDRYDYDGDGDFNEPDGYLDHFQIVHAGGDESDGDPQQGEDAIWAHRSYVNGSGRGTTGPASNLLGGTQLGDTGLWIGDYTMQPENGGLSVFAHEYGHDLGLPDDYDTSGALNSNNEFWTLMSQSRLNGAGEPIGTRPGDIGAWNKLQLGWLSYASVTAGDKKVVNLGPQEYNTKNFQAAVVTLPDKSVTTDLGAPYAGTKQYFSGNDDDLNTSLSKTVDLSAATTASLQLKGRYNIEADYDYLYFEASTNGGSTWTALDGTVGGAPFAKDASDKPALTGAQATWSDIVVPLDAYAGQKPLVRLHYVTDGGVSSGGFFGDNLTVVIDGVAGPVDGAEGLPTWTSAGFSAVAASSSQLYPNFYIAGYRTYASYDKYLQTGPYNFGWASTKPDWVEHFAYQQGLLISYNDTSYRDNNTATHPGGGRNLIIDAHPAPFAKPDGTLYRSRVMGYDSPFGLTRTDPMILHTDGKADLIRGLPAQPLFDDTQQYYYPENPTTVKLPAVGVKIRVLTENTKGMKISVS